MKYRDHTIVILQPFKMAVILQPLKMAPIRHPTMGPLVRINNWILLLSIQFRKRRLQMVDKNFDVTLTVQYCGPYCNSCHCIRIHEGIHTYTNQKGLHPPLPTLAALMHAGFTKGNCGVRVRFHAHALFMCLPSSLVPLVPLLIPSDSFDSIDFWYPRIPPRDLHT